MKMLSANTKSKSSNRMYPKWASSTLTNSSSNSSRRKHTKDLKEGDQDQNPEIMIVSLSPCLFVKEGTLVILDSTSNREQPT